MAKRNKSATRSASATRAAPSVEPGVAPAAVAVEKSLVAGSTPRSNKQRLRAEAAKRKKRENLLWMTGGVLLVGLMVFFIGYNIWRSRPVVGEQTFPTQGNLHIPFGSVSPITYNSTPPTSGPHYESIAGWGVHEQPVRYEHLIHNLEDGGVVVYYQCPEECPELVAQLREILDPYISRGDHVALAMNNPELTDYGHKDIGARIALTAWEKLLTMDEVDADVIRAFIDRYEGIDHHR